MREIKFRAWDSKREKMFTHPKWVEFSVSATGVLTAKNFNPIGQKGEQELMVMQYTGLKDKNGVEIYEGDIVGGVLYKDYSEHKGKVQYDYNGYRIVTKDKSLELCLTEKLEVIGNIYENTELLEKDND